MGFNSAFKGLTESGFYLRTKHVGILHSQYFRLTLKLLTNLFHNKLTVSKII